MKRGVVVEENDDFVTLLTPDGQFLKTRNKKGEYVLGEEITFFPS
ncbi:anti-sigma factor domain-containing protein [Metabacillus herbersteinensis]|uniref:Anti-sigma factor domain-containing protein n=1 Tax=Metabacillus herbersteinensis TaxID=283816 RepID=A0ABV6GIL7_9BACI